jgi:MGT family glycosyltransferase
VEAGLGFHEVLAPTMAGRSPWSTESAADIAAIAAEEADVVIVDYMLANTIAATTDAGLPTVAFVHTLYREFSGLSPEQRPIVDRADLALVASIPALDAPGDDRPNVRYIGAQLDAASPDAGFRPPPGDAPMVLVSLGTTDMGEGPMLQRVLDAAADLPIRMVATVGEHLVPATFRAPANAIVSGYIPHAVVMPHASAFVTHCGLGGIMAALHHNVPMVCMPIDRDQPHNASRVDAVGCGIVIGKDATISEIQAAIGLVLTDPSYALAVPDDGVVDGVVAVESLVRP